MLGMVITDIAGIGILNDIGSYGRTHPDLDF